MASIIKFSGHRDDSLLVMEDVDEVASLMREAGGGALRLTRNIGTPVFVNADRVAYWHDYTRTRPGLDSRRGAPAAPAGAD
jgi:hypothetical protein